MLPTQADYGNAQTRMKRRFQAPSQKWFNWRQACVSWGKAAMVGSPYESCPDSLRPDLGLSRSRQAQAKSIMSRPASIQSSGKSPIVGSASHTRGHTDRGEAGPITPGGPVSEPTLGIPERKKRLSALDCTATALSLFCLVAAILIIHHNLPFAVKLGTNKAAHGSQLSARHHQPMPTAGPPLSIRSFRSSIRPSDAPELPGAPVLVSPLQAARPSSSAYCTSSSATE